MIKAIVCIGANGVMGKNGQMPWGDKPLDGKHFRSLTEGHTVVMGRKTFESMGCEPLPNRHNVVLSRQRLPISYYEPTFDRIEPVLAIANRHPEKDVWVIGGSEVYKAFLPYIEEFYITTVGEAFEGDTYFPDIHRSYDWKSEYLGMERVAYANMPPIDWRIAHMTDYVEELPKPTAKQYDLIYRKLTKVRREYFSGYVY
jgi:dihydrofolate reductase